MIDVDSLLVHLGWLPLLLVLFVVYYKERYPAGAALVAYFLGGLMTLPAWILQVAWRWAWLDQAWAQMWDMPLWIVPVEEGAKLVAGILAYKALGCHRCRSFFPLALSAGLGFAVTETAVAVMVWGLDVMPVRLLVSVPGHVLFTSLAAVGVAGCKQGRPNWVSLLGWGGLSVVAHTGYNLFLLHGENAELLDAVIWLLVLAAIAVCLGYYRLRAKAPVEVGEGVGCCPPAKD